MTDNNLPNLEHVLGRLMLADHLASSFYRHIPFDLDEERKAIEAFVDEHPELYTMNFFSRTFRLDEEISIRRVVFIEYILNRIKAKEKAGCELPKEFTIKVAEDFGSRSFPGYLFRNYSRDTKEERKKKLIDSVLQCLAQQPHTEMEFLRIIEQELDKKGVRKLSESALSSLECDVMDKCNSGLGVPCPKGVVVFTAASLNEVFTPEMCQKDANLDIITQAIKRRYSTPYILVSPFAYNGIDMTERRTCSFFYLIGEKDTVQRISNYLLENPANVVNIFSHGIPYFRQDEYGMDEARRKGLSEHKQQEIRQGFRDARNVVKIDKWC